MSNAVFFGDGKCKPNTRNYRAAEKLSANIAALGFNIVNGGYYGIMEASAKGASKFPVERIGIVLENSKVQPNKFLSSLRFASSYLERLKILVELGDIFFVFEGGSGTLLEVSALVALCERNLLNKPIFLIGKKWKIYLDFLFLNIKLKKSKIKCIHYIEKVKDLNLNIVSKLYPLENQYT